MIEDLYRRTEHYRARLPRFRFVEGEHFLLLGREYELRFSRRILAFDDAFIVPRGDGEAVKNALEKLYRRLAREMIGRKVREQADRFNLTYRTIRIGGASTRWGSCNRNGDLNFTWKLIQCPEPVVDYVVTHELAHRLELEGRERLTVSGVEDVERFDESTIVMATCVGTMVISGEGLHIGKLSLDGGEMHVDGRIDAVSYEDAPAPRMSLLSRLFG